MHMYLQQGAGDFAAGESQLFRPSGRHVSGIPRAYGRVPYRRFIEIKLSEKVNGADWCTTGKKLKSK